MNCESRTDDNKCAVKIVFAESFKISGGKYNRSTNIINGNADNCSYFEPLKKTHNKDKG